MSSPKRHMSSKKSLIVYRASLLGSRFLAYHYFSRTRQSLGSNPKLVWDAHFPAEIGEAGILPELCEERMGLYRERPDVSLGCFVEGLEGFVYLAERSVNENLGVGQGSLSLKAF